VSKIFQHARSLRLDGRVTLFDIDLRSVGGEVQRVSPMTNEISDGKVSTVTSRTNTGIVALPLGQYDLITPGSTALVRMTFRRVTYAARLQAVFRNPAADMTATFQIRMENANKPTALLTNVPGLASGLAVASGVEHITVVMALPTGPHMDALDLTVFTGTTEHARTVHIVRLEAWVENARGGLDAVDINRDDMIARNANGVVAHGFDEMLYRPIRWRGNEYLPRPVGAEGFEITANGSLPRPTFRMSNVLGEGSSLLKNLGDLSGVEVTRWVTFHRFLDDGPTPDRDAHLPKEIYVIDQKATHNRQFIEWQLASILDQQGVRLPSRQVLRSACQLVYRHWDRAAGRFEYGNVTCPYTGSAYFTEKDEATTDPLEDKCSQTLRGCLRRFGGQKRTPFGGFPGAGRITG